MTLPTSTPESSWRGEALPNRFQTSLFPMLWLIFATATLPTSTPEPSPIIIPVVFRLRLEQNTEQVHHAYRRLRGRLPCAVKPFRPHRASEYALQSRKMAIALPDELQEVTVSAMPPNQLQPLVTPLPAAPPNPHRTPLTTHRPASPTCPEPRTGAKVLVAIVYSNNE